MRPTRVAAVLLVLVAIALCGGVSAVNFVRFHVRTRAAEARQTLSAAYLREAAFHADAGRWASTFAELDFAPTPQPLPLRPRPRRRRRVPGQPRGGVPTR